MLLWQVLFWMSVLKGLKGLSRYYCVLAEEELAEMSTNGAASHWRGRPSQQTTACAARILCMAADVRRILLELACGAHHVRLPCCCCTPPLKLQGQPGASRAWLTPQALASLSTQYSPCPPSALSRYRWGTQPIRMAPNVTCIL